VITRLGSRPGHPATRAYAERRTKEGLPEAEIIRCLKRYVAREVCHQLRGGAWHPGFPGRLSPLFGCRTPVLAFDRSAGRPGTLSLATG